MRWERTFHGGIANLIQRNGRVVAGQSPARSNITTVCCGSRSSMLPRIRDVKVKTCEVRDNAAGSGSDVVDNKAQCLCDDGG